MEATITMTPLDCPHDTMVRVFILNPRKMHIDVGRASKNTTKGLFAGKFNAWFDSPIMSREHARIVLEPTGLKVALIQDNGSTHGTFIKNRRLEAKIYTEFNDGDVVTFGTQVTAGEHSHKPRDFRIGLEWRVWQDPLVNHSAQRELQNVFRIRSYDSESSAEDRSRDSSLEITNVCKRPPYSIPSSIDDSDSDDFEEQDLDSDMISGIDERGRDRALDNVSARTTGIVIENSIAVVDQQESVQDPKLHAPPAGSSQNHPIDVENAEGASNVAEDENTSEDGEGPEILPIGQNDSLSSSRHPNPPDASFTAVNSTNSNTGSYCAQPRPKVDVSISAQEPAPWPPFTAEHSKYGQFSTFKASEPSVHHWSYSMNGPHDLPTPTPSRYEEGPFSSAYETRFIPEALRRPGDFAEREQLQYNFHPTTHQYTSQIAATNMGNRLQENSGYLGKSKYEATAPRLSTAIENMDVSAPLGQSSIPDGRGDHVLLSNNSLWKHPSYAAADRAWTPDETDNPKGSNLKISDLVHSYSDTTRGLKRKACEMTPSIEARVPTPLPALNESDANASSVLHSARTQYLPKILLDSSSQVSSIETSHDIPLDRDGPVPNLIEGPVMKKTKLSSTTTTKRSGKFVSGFLVGVAGTIAATIAALVSSASADVWQEALHEATHNF